ncbi:hypothetical protein [Streptomyces sioyaensis]|uniref:hypothetical protein n=1 Tax=Streptomyces sioyaensis TaxID=67364 RepID=UPI0034250D77
MNDEGTPGTEDGKEEFDQGAEPRQSPGPDLSSFMKSTVQTEAWLTSIEPVLHQLGIFVESTRRSIVAPAALANTANVAYQATLDAEGQIPALAVPVLALQSHFSDIYDWHSRISDVMERVSLPLALLKQLAETAAPFLPANLSGLDTEDLDTILEMSQNDGLSLAWAPRTETVVALLALATREERVALLSKCRDDVLDDVDASLETVTHPELTDLVTILRAVIRTARAGFNEGAQALAGNVLETAMKKHGNAWIRRSFPQVTYPKAGHHGTIGSVLDDTDDWSDLTLLQFKHYLALAGMRNAFGPGATQDTFNRHLGAHHASPDTYRPEFVLPAILLAHTLLRALNQDLGRPGDGEDEA